MFKGKYVSLSEALNGYSVLMRDAHKCCSCINMPEAVDDPSKLDKREINAN